MACAEPHARPPGSPQFMTSTGRAHLIHVDDSLPGITRKKAGKGWTYLDAEGQRISAKAEIERLNSIALPPAYVDAWYSPSPDGHILATGYDDKGRKQYRYHPDFRAHREAEKFDGLVLFGRTLPLIRQRVEQDLGTHVPSLERASAAVVRLLDEGHVRIGSDGYTKKNKSYGATTLTMDHTEQRGSRLTFRYIGKSGKEREVEVNDPELAQFVDDMSDLPGQRLFQWLDDDGGPHSIHSHDVNGYLREASGEAFTAKSFRTWGASVVAFEALASGTGDLSIKAVAEAASDELGNTPTIARNSYIHPALIALAASDEREWRAGLKLPRRTQWLSRHERGMMAFLESDTAETLMAKE